ITRAPSCSTTSSMGPGAAANSMVYSMPAQPPFLTPSRSPNAPSFAIRRLICATARGVRVTGLLPGMPNMSRLRFLTLNLRNCRGNSNGRQRRHQRLRRIGGGERPAEGGERADDDVFARARVLRGRLEPEDGFRGDEKADAGRLMHHDEKEDEPAFEQADQLAAVGQPLRQVVAGPGRHE